MTVRGETAPVDPGFTVVDREWRDGDTVSLSFDMPLERLERNGRVAFRRGPLLLARDARKEATLFGKRATALTAPISLAPDALERAESLPPDSAEGEMLRLLLPCTDGASLLLTDYASCGKHWREENGALSVWLNP